MSAARSPAPERVLATLELDGKRRWLRPKLARGRFLRRRRLVGYSLIALFVTLPLIEIDGRQALLIDLARRELVAFGAVFRPTDGYMLMLLGIAIVSAVFLVTALAGRVWCGWGCPQTVYLELVFRPIERLLEGTPAQQTKLARFHWRRIVKWSVFAVIAFGVANVFLAYFVGTAQLSHWVFHSPAEHLTGFAIVLGVWALMLFDFAWFREQTCMVACPYGRLQSVLLDRQSLIVGYDARRGEPRGQRKKLAVVGESAPAAARGDCVDCSACVAVCPTGIDIRNGLQMECIGCAQCIDACDNVMDKLSKPRGLIGYTSQARLAASPGGVKRSWLRVRTIVYPALLVLAGGLLVIGVAEKAPVDVAVERISGPLFYELPDGGISSQARVRIENASDQPHHYTIYLTDAQLKLRSQARWEVAAREHVTVPVLIDVPRDGFEAGKRRVTLQIADDQGFHSVVDLTLIGPATAGGGGR